MNTRHTFKTKQVTLAAVGFLLVGATINPALDSIATFSTGGDNQVYVGESPSIPSFAYSAAEIECRTWHRNRMNRPYEFLLRQ